VAGRVPVTDLQQGRDLGDTAVEREEAAGVKATACGRVERGGEVVPEQHRVACTLAGRVSDRGGGQQRLRVRMCGGLKIRSREPFSTSCPRYITAISSARYSTADRSWVMNRHAKPMSHCRSASRLSTDACTDTSSALVGSSAPSSVGLEMSARAMLTRWRCPPDSSWE